MLPGLDRRKHAPWGPAPAMFHLLLHFHPAFHWLKARLGFIQPLQTPRLPTPSYLEVDGRCADLLRISLESMTQVATMGQIQTHDAIMGLEEGSVNLHHHHTQLHNVNT
jgi:hypothetical protein